MRVLSPKFSVTYYIFTKNIKYGYILILICVSRWNASTLWFGPPTFRGYSNDRSLKHIKNPKDRPSVFTT